MHYGLYTEFGIFHYSSRKTYLAAGWFELERNRPSDAAPYLEQGAFAGAVVTDDAEHLALLYFEVDVAQRPEDGFVLFAELTELAQAAEVVDGRAQDVEELAGDLSRCLP